ncbi:MAG: DUF4381 domain-containing protein [Gammaproteobacteria bacterium]|nr:DUF4381 domain-containing protein [Gammaproteobacteria bacterium]
MLEPLRSPPPVSWWPPAPGWWLLAILALALLVFAIKKFRAYRLRGAPLREARQTLAAIEGAAMTDRERAQALAALQRRTAISLGGRRACAGLTDDAWARFLNGLSPSAGAAFNASLVQVPYRRDPAPADVERLMDATQHWLQGLETPR